MSTTAEGDTRQSSWQRQRRWLELALSRAAKRTVSSMGAVTRPAAGLTLALTLTSGSAGEVTAHQQPKALEDIPRLSPQDLPSEHYTFLEQDVHWIITDEEREIFLRLDSDAQRELFIEEFWRQRDPQPATPINEYRREHYLRMQIANERFGRRGPEVRPGWRTDRGRILIFLGEPQYVIRLPRGPNTHEAESWFYQALPNLGVPPQFHLIFYRDRSRFRLYSPAMDGAEGLLNQAGKSYAKTLQMQFEITSTTEQRSPVTTAELLISGDYGASTGAFLVLNELDARYARIAMNLIPGDAPIQGRAAPLSSEYMLDQVAEIPYELMPDPEWAYNVLHGTTRSEVRFENLELEAAAVGLLDANGDPFIHYALSAPGATLNLEYSGTHHTLSSELTTLMTDHAQRPIYNPEPRRMRSVLGSEAAARAETGSVLYTDRFPAITGEFSLDLSLRNDVTGQFGRTAINIWIPEAKPAELRLGVPILCRDVVKPQNPVDDGLSFQIHDLSLSPAVGTSFPSGAAAFVFHQVMVPENHAQPIRISYTLQDAAGLTVQRQRSTLSPTDADRNGVINQVVQIELRIPPGDYGLLVDSEASTQESVLLPLRVTEAGSVDAVVDIDALGQRSLYARRLPLSSDPAILLERARQYSAVGDRARALEIVGTVLELYPDSNAAKSLAEQLQRSAGR